MSRFNPVPRIAVVAAALVLLAPAGCDRVGSQQAKWEPATASPAPRVLTEGELRSVLLAAADLPTGYAARPADTSPDPASSSRASDPQCAKLYDEFENGSKAEGNTAAEANAEFAKGRAGPFLNQSLESHRDQAVLVEAMHRMRDVVAKCGEFTTNAGDGDLNIRMTPAPFSSLGDETVAIKMDATGTTRGIKITIAGYLVLTRVANTLSVITHIGLRRIDAAVTEGIVRKAVEKITPLARSPRD